MSVTAERLMVEVQADVRQALSKLDQVEKKAGSSSSRMGKMAKGMAGAFSGAAIAGGIAKTVNLAKSFDLTMRQVGVQTGQTGEKLKGLGDLAMKMGADTAFSAQDASNAMLELAKGGLTAADIRAGALKDTLTLAAAGGLEMGNAAGYMTQALNTFGLKAKDGGQIAAALAGGANASTASVESLGMALSQVGPGAANAGMSIQETVAALAAFDNAGIKGSDAGTSLKTMLTSLVPATDKARGTMKKYGLEFVNANGSFKSMTQIAGELKTGLGDLSQAQQTAALRAIFGSDATRAATVLMNEGTKGVQKYVKATKDQSTVQKMANTAMGGAEGAWNQLTGSVETLGIKIGTALLPAFTKGANGAAGLVNAIAGSGDELAAAWDWVKGFAEGFLAPFQPALAPLKDLLVGAADGADTLRDSLRPVTDFISDNSKAFGVAAGVITALFIPAMVKAGVAATVTKVKVVASFIAQQAQAARTALMVGVNMVRMGVFYVQYAALVVTQQARVVAAWVASQAAAVRGAAVHAAQLARVGLAYVAMGARAAASMAATVARTVAGWVLMGTQSLLQAARMAAAWVIAMGPVGWAIAAAIAVAVAVVKNWDKIKAVTVKVFKAVGAFVEKVWSGIKAGVTAYVNAVKAVISKVWGWITGFIRVQVNMWKAVISAVWNGIKSVVGSAVDFVKRVIQGWKVIGGWVKGFFTRAKDGAVQMLGKLLERVKAIPGDILRGLGNLGDLLLGAGKDIIQGLLDGIGSMIGKVKGKLNELTNLLPDWKGPRSKDKKLLVPAGRAIIGGLIRGISGTVPQVKAKLTALTKDIERWYSAQSSRVRSRLSGAAERRALDQLRENRDKLRAAVTAYGQRLDSGMKAATALSKGLSDKWETAAKTMKAVRDNVAEAFTGRQRNRWLATVDRTNRRLAQLYRERVSIQQKAAQAARKLEDLTQAKSDFMGNVFSGMAGQANVTNAGSTAAAIAQSLTDQVAKVKRFADMLSELRSKGFSDAVVMQVASAGVEGGYQAAQALVNASWGQVSSINSSMKTITDQAAGTSKALAGQMYDAGIMAAEGLVKGLKLKEDQITATIKSMALNLAAALKRALGIHSPSRVFQALGEMLPAGLVKGIRARFSDVKKASTDMAHISIPKPPPPPGLGGLQTTPTLAGLQGGVKAGASVTFVFKTYNPVAEPQSRTTNKALDRAGSLGLV